MPHNGWWWQQPLRLFLALLSVVPDSCQRAGVALQRALERSRAAAETFPSSLAVQSALSQEECLGIADEDLRHIAARTSAQCFERARRFYCTQVEIAEKAAYKPKLAGQSEERCSTTSTSNNVDSNLKSDVEMELMTPQSARVAYLVLSYDRLNQVRRLLRRLAEPQLNFVLVHIDAKVVDQVDLDAMRAWSRREFAGSVGFFSEFQVHRGGRSMLDVQLRAFEILLSEFGYWDYFINLSDSHFPAESVSWIGAYLWLHRGANYARITSTKYYDPTLQGGSTGTYSGPRREDLYIACDRSLAFECDGNLFSVSPGVKYPQVLEGVTAASGPEWIILSREFVDFVHRSLASDSPGLVRDIYEDLSSLSIPEETFFQTVLMSSYFCQSLVRHDFLYLDLYNAPWRTSPASDFPFQSPRPLNASHLAEIYRDEPWFVRKIDEGLLASSLLRHTLEEMADLRSARASPISAKVSWAKLDLRIALAKSLASEFGEHAWVVSIERMTRPKQLQSMYTTPHVLRIRIRLPYDPQSIQNASGTLFGAAIRQSSFFATLLLTERMAVPIRKGIDFGFTPVVALRIGCEWSEEEYAFHDQVSVLSSTCGSVSLVAYVTNLGFEGSVNINWLYDGRLVRRSGGQIPKGFTMFIDRMVAPFGGLKSGRWTIRLSDQNDRTIGARDFFVYSDNTLEIDASVVLAAFREFFSWSTD